MERTLASIRASRPRMDRVKVEATTEEDIRRYMIEDGEDPDAELGSLKLVIPPAVLRQRLAMDQDAFAAALSVPVSTLRDWEEGRVLPDAGTRSLLAAVSRDPETVFRLIAGQAAA